MKLLQVILRVNLTSFQKMNPKKHCVKEILAGISLKILAKCYKWVLPIKQVIYTHISFRGFAPGHDSIKNSNISFYAMLK